LTVSEAGTREAAALAAAVGWVAGLVVAVLKEMVAIYRLIGAGRYTEALAIYRWFRPLLDLDVSAYLVQNIKLSEVLAIRSSDRVGAPRNPLSGARRIAVEKIVSDVIMTRRQLPVLRS
jgi:dihydrodipicolinate synthase/N-acetylneuraminate lyase